MEQLSHKDFETYFIEEVEISSERIVLTLVQEFPYLVEKDNPAPLNIITLINHDFSGNELTFKEKFDENEELGYEIIDDKVFKIFDFYGEGEIKIQCAEIQIEKKPYDKKHLWKYLHLYEKALKESEDENRVLKSTVNEIAEFLKKEVDRLDKKLEMLENQNDSRISHWKKERENFLKVQRILNK